MFFFVLAAACIHEPPRRVLIKLPNSTVKLSDYLFPGEGHQETIISVQELFDICKTTTIEEVEGQSGRFIIMILYNV